MTSLNITIESIKTIKLAKNENLVFKLGDDVNKKDLQAFTKAVKKALPKLKDRVLFIAGDIEITKVVQ